MALNAVSGDGAPDDALPDIFSFRRIVVKVGSSLLVDRAQGDVRHGWLRALVDDLAALHEGGRDVLVVSSGSVALGRSMLGFPPGPLKLADSQAAAAVGQIALARTWAAELGARAMTAGQILLTLRDTEERRRYLNARDTIGRLLEMRAVPVINENDTVATSEIRYGDNDRLAARVAGLVGADALILLSDVDGLYTAPPHENPEARLIPVVPRITFAIESMAGGAASELSRGGMRTKIEAAKIATAGGAHMVIADGRRLNPVGAIAKGGRCTWFLTHATPLTARKTWIAGSLEPRGTLHVDEGAVRALLEGASLLPAGVRRVEGRFSRGDCVILRTLGGAEIGRGLVAYDVDEAARIMGRNSRDIESVLGVAGSAELVHRDNMALRAGDQTSGASGPGVEEVD